MEHIEHLAKSLGLRRSNSDVSWGGVHVIKQEVNTKEILFADPGLDLDSSRVSEEIDASLDTTRVECTKSVQDFQYCKRLDEMESHETPNRQVEERWKISKQKENSEITCYPDMDQSDDKILLHPKTLDAVTEDSTASVSIEGTDSIKGKPQHNINPHYFRVPLLMLSLDVFIYFASLLIQLHFNTPTN